MAELSAGSVLGDRFEIIGVLGEGGMATVYLAQDRVRQHRVALKVLHGHLARQEASRKRLRREVEAAGRIRHPAALVPTELFELDGKLCLSMPVHTGRTLADAMADGTPLPPEQVRAIALQLCDVLALAHRNGVVHRDITPSNVMIDDNGAVMLMDFGLARLDEQRSRTSTGVVGTPGYVAPELYGGARADARSDLYALGAVLYLAATGRQPFAAPTPLGALQQQLEESFPPLSEHSALSPGLAATIEACLSKDPDARPQAAAEVQEAFETGTAPRMPQVSTPSTPARPHLPRGRHAVVLRENQIDQQRRNKLRQPRVNDPFARTLQEAVDKGLTWGRSLLGLEATLPPEELLARAVAGEAGLPPDALQVSPVVLEKRFVLVQDVDATVAARLAQAARDAGFDTELLEGPPRPTAMEALGLVLQDPNHLPAALKGQAAALAVGWAGLLALWVFLTAMGGQALIPLALIVVLGLVFTTKNLGEKLAEQVHHRQELGLPIAYGEDLRPWLSGGYAEALPPPAAEAPPSAVSGPEPAPSRGGALMARTQAQLDGLDEALRDQALPDVMRRDLSRTSGRLRAQAEALSRQVTRLEAALASANEVELANTVARVAARLERLDTLARAGSAVDEAERAQLQRALASHRESLELAEADEARLTKALAHLLEIGATATRARRLLLDADDAARTGTDLLAQLEREASLASEALGEVERRGARRRVAQ